MEKNKILFYHIFGAILIGLSTNSLAMMEEVVPTWDHTSCSHAFLKVEEFSAVNPANTKTKPQNRELVSYDKELEAIYGKNLSGLPLSKSNYEFVLKRIGIQNTRPFVLKTGPQIIFEDEVNLLK